MGTTSGTLSDEGPEPLGVFAEVKPLHSTFSQLQKLRHSSAICFHYLFFKRVCLGYLPYPPPWTRVPGFHVWGQWDWQRICH